MPHWRPTSFLTRNTCFPSVRLCPALVALATRTMPQKAHCKKNVPQKTNGKASNEARRRTSIYLAAMLTTVTTEVTLTRIALWAKRRSQCFLTNESGFGKKTNKNVSLRYQSNLSVSVSVAKAVFSKEDCCSNAIIRGEKIAHCFLETRNKH